MYNWFLILILTFINQIPYEILYMYFNMSVDAYISKGKINPNFKPSLITYNKI